MSVHELRPKPKPAPKAEPKSYTTQFYCTRCDGGEFTFTSQGSVTCVKCGAWMKNLIVQWRRTPA